MKKKVLIIIPVVIVAIIGIYTGLAAIFHLWPFSKSASENFALQAKKLFKSNEVEVSYEDYSKALNTLKSTDTSSTAEFDISMNVSVPTSVMTRADQQLLNATKLKVASSYDASSKEKSFSLGLLKNNSSVVSLDAVMDKTSIAVKSDELTDKKYVKLDLSKIEDYAKKNNLTYTDDMKSAVDQLLNVLGSEGNNQTLYDLLYISENDYNSIKNTHSDTLTKYVDSKNYSSKSVKTSVNGEDVKTTAYSLVLDGNDAYEYIKKYFEAYKNDETLKKLLINKVDTINKYMNDVASSMGSSSSSIEKLEFTSDDYNEMFDEILKSLEESKSEFTSLKKCLKITIYSVKDEPVKMDLAILNDKKDKDGSVIFTEEIGKNKTTYTVDVKNVMKLAGNDSTSELSTSSYASALTSALEKIVITDKFEKSGDSRKGTITASVKVSGQSQDLIEIDYELENSKSTEKVKIEVKPSSTITALMGSSSISFSLNAEVTGLDTDTQTIKYEISAKYGSYSGKLTLNGKVSQKANIPNLSSSNTYDLFSMSQEESQKVLTDLANTINTKLPTIASTYGIKMPTTTLPTTTTTITDANSNVSANVDTSSLTDEQKAAIAAAAQQAASSIQAAQSTGDVASAQAAAQAAQAAIAAAQANL